MKNIKVLIDGKEIQVPNGLLTVAYEYNEIEDDVPRGSQVQFQFTSEGVIVDYVNDDDVIPLSQYFWEDFLDAFH